ncbi:phage major capsid protein [Rhodococcus sp. 11-3]|uniref:phage major capsid protein n=1 Tax=Rhodococcus sp. 11-3 TaxID=2854796 RepID=UPI0020414D90|nr:phage major capsid protein [Rhodococcus sp. 11-3]USC17033.1 phage major capsid protein [Rhodococcus sp. 11-3]
MTYCTRNAEFRQSDNPDENDGYNLRGYAAVFNQDTEINSWEGRFLESIAPGAFKKTLRERKGKIIMQYDHGRDVRVGTVPIGYYKELREDEHGLDVDGRLHQNDVVEPVRQAIESGAIGGMSFKFRVVRDEWRDAKGKLIKPDKLLDILWNASSEDGLPKRIVKEIALYEAGPVSTPAYGGTSVGIRSEDEPEISREQLVAQYRKTMLVDEETRSADEPPVEPTEAPADEAEQREDADTETEQREDDAAPETPEERDDADPVTSSPVEEPEDAARTGTSEESTPTPTITRKVIPMTKAELIARAAELRAKLADFAGDEALEEARQAEFDSTDAELRKTVDAIKEIEARQARLAELASEPGHVERTAPRAPAVHIQKDVFDVDAIRKDATSEEDLAVRFTEGAERAVESLKFARVTGREKAQERISELLEEDTEDAKLAKRILVTGSPLYERAFGKALRAGNTYGLSQEELRAMSLGADSGGGYAVPVQLDPTVILTNDGHIGDLRRLARVETIVGKEKQFITSDGISVSRDGTPAAGEIGRTTEAAEVSDGSFTLAQPTISVERVQGFVPFSIEIDQDWGGLRSEITRMLADAKSREENESFVLGDGTGTQPGGVVGSMAAGSLVAATGTETFTAADIYNLETELAPRWRGNAKWLGNKSTYNVIRQFADADGHDFWERIGNGLPPKLLGYDIHENSFVPVSDATVTATSRVLVFGDFSNFIIVDRVGMSVELVPHIFGTNGRPTGQRGVYAIWRNNAKVLVPNAFRILTVATTA